MARLQLRRVFRNVTFFIFALLLYILYSSQETGYIESLQHSNEVNEPHLKDVLVVDDFWVPERAFLHRDNINGQNGPGERGNPVTTSSGDSDKRRKAYQDYGFNQYASDKISLNRTIPDTRPTE